MNLNFASQNKISTIRGGASKSLPKAPVASAPQVGASKLTPINKISAEHFRANSALSFCGNASRINNACIITGEKEDLPLLVTKENDSYVVEFDSQTEVMYGIDAVKYLDNNRRFPYDTQVIFPKKADGILHIDGKDIKIKENSSVLLSTGTEADVELTGGYPMIVITKKDFDWYERYKRDAKDENIKNKFSELMYFNSHLYNGEFTPDALLPKKFLNDNFLKSIHIDKWESRNNLIYDIYDKKALLDNNDKEQIEFAKNLIDRLHEKNLIESREDGYVRFKNLYEERYNNQVLLQEGFSPEEIDVIAPIYNQARQVKLDSKFSAKNPSRFYRAELIEKMKEKGILHNNKKDIENIYWKKIYGNTQTLRDRLEKEGFDCDEQNEILTSWYMSNKSGFDISGLKFINDNAAIYDLDDKLNNWTQEKTNWLTNSTAPQNSKGETPFIGVSMVQMQEEKPMKMSDIRAEEKLHSHPNLDEKRQTEVYLVTSGAAALNVVKDGKATIKLLKEGDLAVVSPGVAHCVNSVKGEYEHICAQVPSAFQYGFGFKQIVEPPSDYNEERLTQEAFEAFKNL